MLPVRLSRIYDFAEGDAGVSNHVSVDSAPCLRGDTSVSSGDRRCNIFLGGESTENA